MAHMPPFLATGIGSMPFTDVNEAIDIVFEAAPECPFWPQLPRLGLNEQMEIQYSGGIPRAVIDRERERLYFDTTGDYSEEIAEFYTRYLEAIEPVDGDADYSSFAMSPDFASGLWAFLERLKGGDSRPPFVKVQSTGPCSFSLTIVDEKKRSIFYNEEFRDIVIKALAMKCRWQIRTFAPYAGRVVCFLDEPILSAFGSSTYVSVSREDVVAALAEVIEAIHAEGALAGIHCCGNTEWSIPIESGADIVNFDAYQYGDTIAMYPEDVKSLFERDGMLAWGIVPTSEDIRTVTPDMLISRLEDHMRLLASKGIDIGDIRDHCIVTPSCGTGSMDPDDARLVFPAAAYVSERLRQSYGGGA